MPTARKMFQEIEKNFKKQCFDMSSNTKNTIFLCIYTNRNRKILKISNFVYIYPSVYILIDPCIHVLVDDSIKKSLFNHSLRRPLPCAAGPSY